MMNGLLDAALRYANAGIPVFPCQPQTKAPYPPRDLDQRGRPIPGTGGHKKATTDTATIRAWWTKWPDAWIGIPTGLPETFDGLDLDCHPGKPNGYVAIPEWRTLSSVIQQTPSGGAHALFRYDPLIKSTTSQIAPGVDTRGRDGYVIVAPSPGYKWLNGGLLDGLMLGLPDWPAQYRPDSILHCSKQKTSSAPEQSIEMIRAAVGAMTNPDLDWEQWSARGMALFRASGGSDEGLELFDEFSRKSEKYEPFAANERWEHWASSSPPTRIGFGSLAHWADEATGSTAWRDAARPAAEDEFDAVEPRRKASEKVIPIDLWGKFNPPELPRGALPKIIEDFALAQSELMGADPAGLAVGALAVCAAAIPDCIKLQVKEHDTSWCESARLWVALVGAPSTIKSPILRQVARPLTWLDAELARQYASMVDFFDALSTGERKSAVKPKKKRLRIEDTTIEAAQEILRDSPQGVLCLQDELSGWFGAMEKYAGGGRGAQKDRGFWLQSWNGGDYVCDRVNRGQCYIPNLSICLLGGIQPDPLRKIIDDTVDDGLIQRLIPIILRSRTLGKDAEQLDIVGQYEQLVARLAGADSLIDDIADATPLLFKFTPEAQAVRRRIEQRHIDLMASEAMYPKLGAHIGKYDGIFARLCLIWHCIENPHADEISGNTALRVEQFLHGFLLPHAVSFYASMMQGIAHDRLADVAGYILAHKLTVVTNRDMARGAGSTRGLTKPEITAVFEQLDALGWLTPVPGPRPTSPPQWLVNPECHRLFAEKAEEESARRQKAREMLMGIFNRKE